MAPDSDAYRTEWTDHDYPSTAVVEAVMAATGRSQAELDVLSDYVDGDALDHLLTNSGDGVELAFRYDDVDVHVSSTGGIEVSTTA